MEIHVLHRQGMSIRQIAKTLKVSRNTVRRYLRDRAATPSYSSREPKASLLDPFKPYIQERIEAAKPHWIPATVLHQELQARGFQGQVGIVRNYIRQFKRQHQEPVVRFETEPGQQLQVDFTTIRRGRHKLKAFVATLGYSRASYVRFSTHERQDDWLRGIEEAFIYFGGVPRELLFDNAKCLMIERDAFGEGQHRWNPHLLSMAKDYGFKLKACRPYRAKTKGKVERFNGYLKSSFVVPLNASLKQAGLTLDVTMANANVGQWLSDIAHQRVHGTTGDQPQVRLDEERLHLMPLPSGTQAEVMMTQNRALGDVIPAESLQHPLSLYDQLLGVAS